MKKGINGMIVTACVAGALFWTFVMAAWIWYWVQPKNLVQMYITLVVAGLMTMSMIAIVVISSKLYSNKKEQDNAKTTDGKVREIKALEKKEH